ncbi:MAG: hypothetical protein GWM98_05555, partial [Nitrospinaceae bacterium]|nr:hypothetical protein [Nitrospinaceae bacterium]NIR54028.1 hypothetical protein [Nitrospinaceae bacterium]NIS84445.1 hypothetical protein [Nitrospinaceae bacterium]NIT81241.1 hypothetical protein [Nitrospinaceae bacterium]NIU43528.1 hypothetical protein [Nitrospinaceae bacterium]
MFWKKKNKPEKKFKAPEDPRQAFRVAPDPENPVSISLLDQTLELIEISSGGVAFKNEGLKENSSHMVEFILPPGRRI